MLKLYSLISLSYIKQHRLRSFLTFLSVMLGVSLMLSTNILNKSIVQSYKDMINKIAGKSEIIVRDTANGFDAGLLSQVRKTEGVNDAVPSLQIPFAPVENKEKDQIYLMGIDPEIDSKVRDYALAEGRMPDGEGKTVAVSKTFAQRANFKINDKINVLTPKGLVPLTITGILEDRGVARINGGRFAVTGVTVVQELYEREGKYNFIDITLQDSDDRNDVMLELEKAVGGKAEVEEPRTRGEQVDKMAGAIKASNSFFAFSSIFVSLFLIFNTITVAVKERRKEIGTLRALGLTRAQISRLFLAEAFIIGIFSSLAGLLLGLALLNVMKGPAMEMSKYFIRVQTVNYDIALSDFALAVSFGLGACLIAAFYPAREAAKTPPVEAMKQKISPQESKAFSWKTIFGVLIIVASFIVKENPELFKNKPELIMSLGFTVALGAAFLLPVLLALFTRVTSFLSSKIFGFSGRLASDSLQKSPQRTSITVAMLMIGIGIILGMGTYVSSQKQTVIEIADSGYFGEIVVTPTSRLLGGISDIPVTADLKEEIEKTPGVRQAEIYQEIEITWQEKQVKLHVNGENFQYRTLIEGNHKDIRESFKKNDGVCITQGFVEKYGVHYGDSIEINTPAGIKKFEVVGVYQDITAFTGGIAMDWEMYKKFWNDNSGQAFSVYVENKDNIASVTKALAGKLEKKYGVFVQSNKDYTDDILKTLDSVSGITKMLQLITMIVAFMGVINTLIVSVLERVREIGILRAIGTLRREIGKMIFIEAGLIGFYGTLAGILLGVYLAHFVVKEVAVTLFGFYYSFAFDWNLMLGLIVIAMSISLLAGWYPAARAAKTNIINAIEYE